MLQSFVVAYGDTGKFLSAVCAMLMSPKGSERLRMPEILVSLQRSVTSVMLGKTDCPDFMSSGVVKDANLDSFKVRFLQHCLDFFNTLHIFCFPDCL